MMCRIIEFKKIIILSTVFVAFAGCTRSLPPEQFVEYYDNNQLKGAKIVERNGYRMTIAWRPGEYYAAREMAFDTTLSQKELLKRYGKAIYIIAGIVPATSVKDRKDALPVDNLLDKGEILERVYKKNEQALLVRGADTIKAADLRYERDWENATVGTYIIAFKNSGKNLKKYDLILRDFKIELGTVVVPLAGIVKNSILLRG